MEQACQNLEPHDAEELRAEIRGSPNIHTSHEEHHKEEAQALAELRRDQSRVILTADKGVVKVQICWFSLVRAQVLWSSQVLPLLVEH